MKKSVIFAVSVLGLVTLILSVALIWHSNIIAEKRIAEPYYAKLKFTLSLLNLLHKYEQSENIIYSPHSVYQALLLTYFGTAGETEKELEQLLGLLDWAKNKTHVENTFKLEKHKRNEKFTNQSIEFVSVNQLYV